jgi:hypothetical protein
VTPAAARAGRGAGGDSAAWLPLLAGFVDQAVPRE